ncbi:DUF1538 domain-containing protein [Parablautia intestinalis]|uniref:DUF1538 domain-containing protein n=1 Tax=Parablautia intestinalis TaxID=2320100 RepID=A0A3A9B0D1_9FIRM|nr:DUF1538 domain-containing protein [Lachnospiraceae bacterium]RKI92125.1 DUF1538 domain-containing protein [Parablautia intestinalis]
MLLQVNRSKLKEKLNETLKAVFPILAIVLILCFTIAPIPPSILMCFLIGALLLIVGMLLFNVGVEMSMTTMGERVGTIMTKSRKLIIMLVIGFIMGFIITISEPDLQVLAEQVASIPNMVLILSVAAGVGVFLVIALLRMLFSIALPHLLVFCYAVVFILTLFVPKDFLAVAFDSGGVTTGPMTVPFIMSFGIGIAAIRSDKHAADDSFGLVSLCSVGPIMAVLILGMIYNPGQSEIVSDSIPVVDNTVDLWGLFAGGFPTYIKEMAISLLPIVVFFGLFQIASKDISKKALIKIGIGLVYTYVGLVLFLTGVNVGFMPAGNYLGQTIAGLSFAWIIIPIGTIIGYYIVKAEPAVFVLTKQVEEMTSGAISARAMGTSLSIGVSMSVGLAMVRVLTGISIMWLIIPGYAIALILTFFVPKIFTAIAFDSGGVASGPMTATFLLPFAMGACGARGGNIITDAFGIIAMVAMTPLITIQTMGMVFKLKESRLRRKVSGRKGYVPLEEFGDMEIIEL